MQVFEFGARGYCTWSWVTRPNRIRGFGSKELVHVSYAESKISIHAIWST